MPFFSKKKPEITRYLLGSGTVRKYVPVQGAKPLPTKAVWVKATEGGGLVAKAPRDHQLNLIDGYLDAYHGYPDDWDRSANLGQLYFLTNSWLKWAATNVNPVTKGRTASVEALFVSIADALCRMFDCSVNYLPQILEEYWGRILTPHGRDVDTQQAAVGAPPVVADYLTRAQAEKYRLVFINGLAFQTTWWAKPPYTMVLADSSRVGWTDGRGKTAPRMMEPGYAGFALSMGREFYMAHHRGCFHEHNFFHSSYLGGDTVLCTGTMLIHQGKVQAIKNDSGHYQPTLEHLLSVVQALQANGVAPASIKVTAVPGSWKDAKGTPQKTPLVTDGQTLITRRWLGQGLKNRQAANQANVQARYNHP